MLFIFMIFLSTEDTDDETGQVMQGMDSLPPILGRYVREDNHWFQQELREWEEQLYQPPQQEPAAPTAASTSTRVPSKKKDEAAEPVPQPGPAQEPTGEQGQEPEAELAVKPAVESESQSGHQFIWQGYMIMLFEGGGVCWFLSLSFSQILNDMVTTFGQALLSLSVYRWGRINFPLHKMYQMY